MENASQNSLPNLKDGIPESDLADGGMLVGQVDDSTVLLARRGNDIFAVGATCTHYGGPLGEGLMVEDTVRCPWHHACFSLRTGEALAAPALSAVQCWRVERQDGRIFVREKIAQAESPMPATPKPEAEMPGSVVIIGGGAAGFAAAEMLRREGYEGEVALITADEEPPYDRPNLSKDYLAGKAPEDWIPLRPAEFYRDNAVDLRLSTSVASIDASGRHVILHGGEVIPFEK